MDPSARKWNAIIFSNRAAAHMSLGMHTDAVTDCHHAIQKDPDFSKAYLRRARAYRVRTVCCMLLCHRCGFWTGKNDQIYTCDIHAGLFFVIVKTSTPPFDAVC